MATVLYTLMETLRHLAILTQPVMPTAMGQMLDQLGVDAAARDFTALGGRRVGGGYRAAGAWHLPAFR